MDVQLNIVFLFKVFCKFPSRNRGPLLVHILQCYLSDVFLVFDKTNLFLAIVQLDEKILFNVFIYL